ncbi:MAG: AAA family ATPase [Minisyncoccia bacterium]
MFLKKIILKNFKSFAGKKELEFPAQITAIVGPNGCGKSNILDAIRWVLGEQSYKILRVDEGKDLIFSTKNKSAGFTEVEAIFDNTSNFFPLGLSEVSFSRRIDKEGNNFYYLNHQPVRLKDIIELSAFAKIGVKGFSFVNQGAVENILKVSPEERKEMLEENLGLKTLEIKKEEAERKLSNTQKNLEEAEIIIKEITPHLNLLKRQVNRYQKREQIAQELEELTKSYFSLSYRQLEQERYQPQINKEELLRKIEEIKNLILAKEQLLGLDKEKGLEEKIQFLTQEIFKLQEKKGILLEKISFEKVKTSKNSLASFVEKQEMVKIKEGLEQLLLLQDLSLIKEKISALIERIKKIVGLEERGDEKNDKIINYQEELERIEQEIRGKTDELKKYQEELKEKSNNFKKIFLEIEDLRKEKESLEKEIQKEEILNERYRIHFEDFLKELKARNLSLEEIKSFKKTNEFSKEYLEKRINQLNRELNEIGVVDENLLKEYEETNDRYNFYSKQIEDLKKASEDLKNMIKDLEEKIRKQFQAALKEINKEFNRYFRLMFKGGSAQLIEIKNPEKNYWGVDIKVDVVKAQVKNIFMLSGGEKTLTAIALLFAIINYSNPPLLIVDEIDAALDEENSRRFSEILKELSRETQFIIITHNRIVMEAAGIIYGVTLGKDNSSLLLSAKLEEIEESMNN